MNKVICIGEEIDGIQKEIFGVEGNFKKAIYEYQYGFYEGNGKLIVKTIDDKFWVQDLGHCSCYGPLERWTPLKKYDSLDSIPASDEWKSLWKTIINKAKNLND